MNSKLIENNYLIIPNFISSYRANKLCEEYKEYAISNNLKGDIQVPNCHHSYNYISFLELLCEKTSEVSEILEETVLPTCSYSRVYKKGSKLEKHIDRDSCEISLTVHLGGDSKWDMYIITPNGQEHSISLNPGDAILYYGNIAEHWRNQYEGEWYVQTFLHYITSRGKYFNTYFDREEFLRVEFAKRGLEIKDYHVLCEEKNINDEKNNLENVKLSDTIMKDNSKIISSSSKLEDFIKVFDNILTEDQCDYILNEYKDCNEWNNALIAHQENDRSMRNCDTIGISLNDVININYENRKKIDNFLFNSIGKIINNYTNIFPNFNVEIDTGYDLLKYDEGQFYKQHTDSFKEQQRSLSCSIQLNEDYEGGEFAFFDREIMIRGKKGSVIVFPSNFMYPHEIMPVIKGTRYSIITWLI